MRDPWIGIASAEVPYGNLGAAHSFILYVVITLGYNKILFLFYFSFESTVEREWKSHFM